MTRINLNSNDTLIVLIYISTVIFEKIWPFQDILQNIEFLEHFEFLAGFLNLKFYIFNIMT